MSKESNKRNFDNAMSAWRELDSSGLLSSTDSTVILDRIKYKYKLSPFKYLKTKQK